MPLTKGISRIEIVRDKEVGGLSRTEIAKKRKISPNTVDYHLTMARKEGLIEKVRQQSGAKTQPAETAPRAQAAHKAVAAKPAPSLPQTVEETTSKWWNSLSIGQKLDLMMSADTLQGGQFKQN